MREALKSRVLRVLLYFSSYFLGSDFLFNVDSRVKSMFYQIAASPPNRLKLSINSCVGLGSK